MTKLGTEKTEALLEVLKELVVIGKKVKADNKVDVADLAVMVAVLPRLPVFIEAFKDVGEAFEEAKDIDVAEIVALIQKINALVKEVEAA